MQEVRGLPNICAVAVAAAAAAAVALVAVSAARSQDRPIPSLAEAHPAQTAPDRDALVQPSWRVLTAAYSLRPGEQSVATQEYLARRAVRLSGRRCEPDGPVYEVLGDTQPSSDASSGRTDLLVHFAPGGRPDEVRIERSSGDLEVDAVVALKVCEALTVRDADAGQEVSAGWARLSVRLMAVD